MDIRARVAGFLTILVALGLAGADLTFAQLSPTDIAALQEQGKAEGWTFTVAENDATRRPKHELCGAVEPPDWRSRAHFDPCPPRADLPATFDWRTLPGFPAIRNQGGCGSCWAFAATGVMECAILIDQGLSLNLAEQWLVSCTNAGDCGGGWAIEAYEFVRCNGRQDPCGGNGVVLESDFPYVAYNAPCNCPYAHPHCMDWWAAVGPEWDTPRVEQIKQAILDHGPVSTSVCTNSAFFGYHGGIFNACTNGPVDHDVILVGWDDNQGPSGVWFLRNSWGTSWGEAGYMRTAYGCSRVGYGAAYVDYSMPDCNGNGIRDAVDIADGTSQDCNKNDIPDECDVAGASRDCNGNGVPDECDVAWPLPALVSGVAPVLDWVEIAGTGTPLNLSSDGVAEVPLPFANALFRTGPVMVGNDGAISFYGPPWLPYWNSPIPSGALFGGEPVLAPLWDDLGARTGNVFWQTTGTPPERTFIVEWYNRPYDPGDYVLDGDEVTFQVQVFETAVYGVFAQYLYLDTDFLDLSHDNGASASVGFQMSGASGCQWSYHIPGSVAPGLVLSVQAQAGPSSADANLDGIPDECEVVGDVNCDGNVDLADINPFVLYLSNFAGWLATYPDCPPTNGDINGDGTYGQESFGDINPFVELLIGGT